MSPAARCLILVAGAITSLGTLAADPGSGAVPTAAKPIYLSDSDPVYKFLEALQAVEEKKLYGTKPDFVQRSELPTDLHEEEFRRLGGSEADLQAMRRSLQDEASKPLPTRHENRRLFMQARKLMDILLAIVPEFQAGPLPPLRVGTLLSMGLETQTLTKPLSDQSVIVMNRFLFTIIHEFVKLSVDTIKKGQDEELIAGRLVTFVDRFNADRTRMPQIETNFDSLEEAAIVGAMVESIELFVLAHEYVHVVRKHPAIALAPVDASHVPDVAQWRAVVNSWRQELEADSDGYEIVMHALNRPDLPSSPQLANPAFNSMLRNTPREFFLLLDILDDGAKICKNKVLPARPSADERQQVVSMLTDAILDTPEPAVASAASVGKTDALAAQGHPPPWERYLFLDVVKDSLDFKKSITGPPGQSTRKESTATETPNKEMLEVQESYARLGEAAFSNILSIWQRARPAYLDICKSRPAPDSTPPGS